MDANLKSLINLFGIFPLFSFHFEVHILYGMVPHRVCPQHIIFSNLFFNRVKSSGPNSNLYKNPSQTSVL